MTRYPRQVDREYLSCRSGGLNKIQMIDGGTLDLHQDLVACDRRRRYIVEHQLPTVFQQSDCFHASFPRLCPVGATSAQRTSTKLHKLAYRTACWRARFSKDFRAATAKERLRELLQLGTRRGGSRSADGS